MTIGGMRSRLQLLPTTTGLPASAPVPRMLSWRRGGSGAGSDQSLHGLAALRRGRTDMTGKIAHTATSQRKPKARKFYIISWSVRHKLADFEVENLEAISPVGWAIRPPAGRQGFPVYPEMPRIVIGKRKSGPPPSDIELYHSYWLISDRLKVLFESVDPTAFAFQACDVRLSDGSPGPGYWLCDVVRVLEAFGGSTLEEIRKSGGEAGYYNLIGSRETLVFNESIIGESHIFRTPYHTAVICDQILKDACNEV